MADLITQRSMVEIEGPFVVFLIGMRINKLWKIHRGRFINGCLFLLPCQECSKNCLKIQSQVYSAFVSSLDCATSWLYSTGAQSNTCRGMLTIETVFTFQLGNPSPKKLVATATWGFGMKHIRSKRVRTRRFTRTCPRMA